MTDAEIEEGLRICEAATPGPWVQKGCAVYWNDATGREDVVALCYQREADSKFLTYARTALPVAIEALREARAKIAMIEAGPPSHDPLLLALHDSGMQLESRYLLSEAAQILSIHEVTLKNMCLRGEVPFYKATKTRLFIRTEDLRAFMQKLKDEALATAKPKGRRGRPPEAAQPVKLRGSARPKQRLVIWKQAGET